MSDGLFARREYIVQEPFQRRAHRSRRSTQQATLPWNSFDARRIMHERQASFAQRGRKFMNLRAVGAASN